LLPIGDLFFKKLENTDLRSQLKKCEETIADLRTQLEKHGTQLEKHGTQLEKHGTQPETHGTQPEKHGTQPEKHGDDDVAGLRAELARKEDIILQVKNELVKYQEEKLSLEQRCIQLEDMNAVRILSTSKEQNDIENRHLAMENQNRDLTSQLEALHDMYSELERQQTNKDVMIEQTNKELIDFKENNRVLIEELTLSNASNKRSHDLESVAREQDLTGVVTVQGQPGADEGHDDIVKRLVEVQDQNKHLLEQWQILQKMTEEQRQAYINCQMENINLRTELDRLKRDEGAQKIRASTEQGTCTLYIFSLVFCLLAGSQHPTIPQ